MIFVFPGYTECVDDNIELLVPDDDDGLYAIDILDPSAVRSHENLYLWIANHFTSWPL